MFNIEGTPHEKALLVVSSYIIGFVSAYIAFTYAFPMHDNKPVITYIPTPPTQVAAVGDAQKSLEQEELNSSTPVRDLVYENQGLYFYGVNDGPLLLSKHANAVNMTHEENMTIQEKQGFHTKVPAFEYWTEHNLIYFCESYENENECVPYIYDIADSSLHIVQTSSGPITVADWKASGATMSSVGILQIGDYASVTASGPWIVANQ